MSELLDEQNLDATVEAAGVGAVTEEGSPESSGAAEDSPESSAVAAPTPDIYSTPEFQQAVAEHAASVAQQQQQQFLAQLADALGGQEQQGPPPVPDPWDDNYAEKMAERDQWFMDTMNAQLQQHLAPFQAQQTEQQVTNAVDTAISAHGLKAGDAERVNRFGAAFFTDAKGDVNRAAHMGAAFYKQLRDEVRREAIAEQRQQLGEIASAPGEPGVAGGGLTIEQTPRSYGAVSERFSSRFRDAE